MLNGDICFWLCLISGTRRVAPSDLSEYLPEPDSPSYPCPATGSQPGMNKFGTFTCSSSPWILYTLHGAIGAVSPLRSLLEDESGHWLWGTSPGCAPPSHLFLFRLTWVCTEPSSRNIVKGIARVKLKSLCWVTAVLKARYLLHYHGRSEQKWHQERDPSGVDFS